MTEGASGSQNEQSGKTGELRDNKGGLQEDRGELREFKGELPRYLSVIDFLAGLFFLYADWRSFTGGRAGNGADQ